MKKKLIYTMTALLFAGTLCAQAIDEEKSLEKAFDKSKDKYSFKYDLLSEILQIGLDKGILQGDASQVSFKSTLYGLMVLGNKDYEIDKYYSRMKFQRNLELGGSMSLADNERINGFGLSLKYAIVNRRDLSDRKEDQALDPDVHAIQQNLASTIAPVIQAYLNDTARSQEEKTRVVKFLHDNSNIKDFNVFFEQLKTIVQFSNDKTISKKMAQMQTDLETLNAKYDAITKMIEKRGLLTFSAEGKNAESKWEFAKFKLEYSKGLGFVKDEQNPWDFYLGAFFSMNRDSLATDKKLNRSIGTLKGGINHVLVRKNNQSFVEVLGGFEYNSVFDGRYEEEKSNQLNAVFNVAFRLAPNLYLPLEIKYDPENSNFFGFIRLKWDMVRGAAN